jgi:hypothetical protein
VSGIVSASKSSKPDTRSAALDLVKALAPKLSDVAKANLMSEVLALPKAGKTTSDDFDAETIPDTRCAGIANDRSREETEMMWERTERQM